MQSDFYKYLSLIKLIVWVILLLVDYFAINVFEDPIIAIWIVLIGSFFISRWASYFFFFYIQKFFRKNLNHENFEAESYKLSLLFWMYSLVNILLILLWHWNKVWWLVLLGGFVLLLYFLMMDSLKHAKKSE